MVPYQLARSCGVSKSRTVSYLIGFGYRGVFSTGAMGALAPTILKNRLLAPVIFETNYNFIKIKDILTLSDL